MRLLTAITIFLLIPRIGLADDSGEEHLERAERAEAAGEYVVAQTEYIAAYRLLKDPRIFYYLARAFEADGQAEPAVVYYRRYLREVEVPEQHRKEVLAKIAALEPAPVEPPEDAAPPRAPAPPPAPEIPLEPPGAAPFATAPPRPIAPPPSVRGSTGKTTRWYGWQIMLSDLATVVLAASTENGGVFLAGFVLALGVIHAANGNGGKALGSPALRAGLPLGGALLGLAVADCDGGGGEYCGLGEAAAGVLIGGLAAIIIDYSWARKTIKQPPGYVVVGRCQGPTPCTTLGYAMRW